MGQRSKTETVAAIFQAFLQKPRWRQSELARHVDVGVPALRKHLNELSVSGFQIQREGDHDPPHVWWRVPKDWFPDAVLFDAQGVSELLRLLRRLPRSAARDRCINKILLAAPRSSIAPSDGRSVLAPQSTDNEQTHLPLAEDAATRKICLEVNYFTASRGDLRWRCTSVQRVVVGPPARFIAVCHHDGALKWFRLDNVHHARLKDTVPFRAADQGEVDAMLKESVDGYHHGSAVLCSFFVIESECRWVEHNLPVSMTSERAPGGMRFTTTTAGVLRLARFVVGLGAAARTETPELATLVGELARGALGT